uniref:Uncharacterized protein n=1 Tax=Caenorhabditis japonica TaxID=281687 RepID=A0A8R1E843_CAEJA
MFERKLADTNKVHQLLQHVYATSAPVVVYRIGRQKEDGRLRLLKVVMSIQFAQRDLLKKAHKLKTLCGAGGRPIFLRPSMPPEELAQYYENRRRNSPNQSQATNANATPLQQRKDTPMDQKN